MPPSKMGKKSKLLDEFLRQYKIKESKEVIKLLLIKELVIKSMVYMEVHIIYLKKIK